MRNVRAWREPGPNAALTQRIGSRKPPASVTTSACRPHASSASILRSSASRCSSSRRAAIGVTAGSSAMSASAGPRQSASASSRTRAASSGRPSASRLPPWCADCSKRQVQCLAAHPRDIAPPSGLDRVLAECLPQLRDITLEDVCSGLGRVRGPQLVDEPRRWHNLVRSGEKADENRALAGPREGRRPAVDHHLERAEHAVFDAQGATLTRRWPAAPARLRATSTPATTLPRCQLA